MNKLKTLGPVSAYLIRELLREDHRIFCSREAMRLLKKDEKATADLLAEMVKRQVLFRIKPGLFLIVPLESEDAHLGNWYAAAKAMMGEHLYYIGYYSAMAFHGMTTHPVNDVFIVSSVRRNNRNISGISFLFHYIHPKKFFGVKKYWHTQQEQICFSDPERTVIDGLARPDLCGGIVEVAQGMCLNQDTIDWNRVVDYAVQLGVYAVAKRLGFLMEELSLGSAGAVLRLKEFISVSQAYVILDPTICEGADRFRSRWRLRINFNINEIQKGLQT